jgi:hypothetical protein
VWCSAAASSSVEYRAFLQFGHRRVASFIVTFIGVVLGGGFIKRKLNVRKLLVLEAEASPALLRSILSPSDPLCSASLCANPSPVHRMPRCRPMVVGREERTPSAFI